MEPAAAHLELRVLGPVEATLQGNPLPLGGARQRALLALLLLEPGHSVSADELAEEIWHGRPPPAAQTTIRSYVSRLRSVLGDEATIEGGGGRYALTVEPERVDALQFGRLVREGEQALARGAARRAEQRLEQALELWSGRPFGDVGGEGKLRLEAERLEELRLYALEQRLEAKLALGQDAQLVDELEALVQQHPERERLWAQLMLALYRSGRQAEALEAYGRARGYLDSELGLEPGEELRRLQGQILRQQVPEAKPPEERHNLPAPLTSFVGREHELDELERLLREHRLLTLTGVGGAGKTRLALELARRVLPEFPDGVFFVDLSSLSEPRLVPRQVARALDLREQGGSELGQLLTERLRNSELLLVLDNCEHLLEPTAELLERLLHAGERLTVLATSREHLGVDGEVDFAVPPLALPPPDANPDELRAAAAVGLLLSRARGARPRLTDDDATVAAAARICRDLDGLPLAIELAAARAKALSLDEIAERLADRFRFLVSWRRLSAVRHRTLREAIDWSYDLLSEEERALLARISVFVGGFSLAAVAGVCTDGDAERALELVERLVDASLVVAEERDDGMRYRLLETVRQYAAEHLEQRGETQALQRRHAEHFVAFAEAQRSHKPVLRPWVERLAPEDDNLRGALAWSRDAGETELLLRLAVEIWRFWWVRGEFAEGRRWLATALERSQGLNPELRAGALEGAAGLAWAHGDMAQAAEQAEAARELFVELDDQRGESAAVTVLGHVALEREDYPAARTFFEKSRKLGEQLALVPLVAVALHNLGSTAFGEGDFETASARYREALDLYTSTDDRYGVALSALYLGMVEMERDRHEEAGAHLRHALPVFREMGFLQYSSQCIELIGAVLRQRGQAAEAARLFGGADAVRVRTGQAPTVAARRREREIAAVREALGAEAFEAAWAEGGALRDEELFGRAEQAVSAAP